MVISLHVVLFLRHGQLISEIQLFENEGSRVVPTKTVVLLNRYADQSERN
jgi:hypothetical protein